ncbi:AMP-binding protein [Pseudorhodoferax sp.]|uniref:AMP-binding protein n=1 Tax=Pseudorhodoferax sp. TaxID=1993553 RepID=UPI002DD62918|nr:AMP-binding protein [Pseudorhodoferax sp.]
MRTTPFTHPFAGRNIPWLLRVQAQARPDRPFIIWLPWDETQARTYSFAQFRHEVLRLAVGLSRRGVRAGDRVIVHLHNCPETMLSWFALAELGAVAVLTNARAAPAEMRHYARNSGAVAAITQPALAAVVREGCPDLQWIAVTAHDGGEAPAAALVPAASERFEALYGDAAAHVERPADPTEPLSVQYTSGTTSLPKGVLWTHANSLWAARECAAHTALHESDRHLLWNPLFHTNAQAWTMLPCLWAGASAVVRPRVSLRRFWSTAIDHQCTRTNMTGFLWKGVQQMELPGRHPFRVWDGGGAGCLEETRWGVRCVSYYGMTELVTHIFCGSFALPNPPGSHGQLTPGYQIKLEREDGSLCRPGEPGHLLVRGERGISVFAEYFNDPDNTAAAFDAQGFMRTGDQLVQLEDGSFRFLSRLKDMLRVGGENVAAVEIEAVIAAVPGVFEVAVVAAPHDMLAEVPVAFVRLLPALQADPRAEAGVRDRIQSACVQSLADFKRPREIRFVADFPRSTLDKIAKAELRKRLADPAPA